MTTEVATTKVSPTATWEGFQHEIIARKAEIASQLPSNITADRFVNAAIAAVKQNPDILKATPRSLFAAITKAAQDGLVPDGREGVITVYKTDAAWNPMAYGLRKRARELDGIIIDAQVVFEGDEFEYELGDEPCIKHRPAMNVDAKDASAGVAVYAIFRHPTEGILHREVMTKAQVFATMNQSRAKNSLMWTTFWTEGWRKTCLRRGMKSVPVSPKLERLIARVDEDFDFDPTPPRQIARQQPPEPPADDEIDETQSAAGDPSTAKAGDAPVDEEQAAFTHDDAAGPPADPDPGTEEWFERLAEWASQAGDADALEEIWNEFDVESALADTTQAAIERADALKAEQLARINRRQAEAAGQGDIFPGDLPDATKQAVKLGNTP